MATQFIFLAAAFLWAGCVIAISFMEAWLKFRAPGVAVAVGLGIGKLIFNALNKVEWFFAAVLIICYVLHQPLNEAILFSLVVPVCILFLQTVWLLPALDARASNVISGKNVTRSSLHWYFIIAECIKVAALVIFGWQVFQKVL